MGGFGSGRRKQHHGIHDCLPIDTMSLLKRGLLTDKQRLRTGGAMRFISQSKSVKEKVEEKEHTLSVLVERYAPGEPGEFTRWGAAGHITLLYGVRITGGAGKKEGEQHAVDIPLVVTHPHYGGARYWFLAPCCGRRVRVVYLPLFGEAAARILPECRECLGLHYASQQASYVERHKTYERHLLANYGLYWAAHCYDYELKEHYLEMTPELWALRLQSVIDWNLSLLKEVIQFDLMIYRLDLRNLKSLRYEEDRRDYLARMKEREMNSLELVKVLQRCIAYERLLYEINTAAMPDHLFELYEQITALDKRIDSQAQANAPAPPVEAIEQKVINLEAILKQVNEVGKKKAA